MLANIIVFDVGSTYTKAAAFHMKEEELTFLGRGQSPTTLNRILDGADAALGNDVGVPAVGAPLAHRGGRDSALSGHATMVGESSSIDVFSQARSCAVFEQMCLEAGFSSVSFSSIAPLAGEDPCDGECPGGATFWLADACATI